MKLKRPPSEKRTWPGTFLSLVRERHPDYKINTDAKGRFTELCREVDGLLHLQSTVWLHDQYSHCFAVSLTLEAPGHLNSPFWVGGRFDHNHTIFWAFERDLGAPVRGSNKIPGLHSTHAHRSGFAEIVKHCTANAETHLAGHYRRQLATAAPLLLRCVELITRDPKTLTDQARHNHHAAAVGSVDLRAQHFAIRPKEWQHIAEDQLPASIVASAPDKFTPYVGDFASIAARLQKLT